MYKHFLVLFFIKRTIFRKLYKDDGEQVSTKVIKKRLSEIIESEDKKTLIQMKDYHNS